MKLQLSLSLLSHNPNPNWMAASIITYHLASIPLPSLLTVPTTFIQIINSSAEHRNLRIIEG